MALTYTAVQRRATLDHLIERLAGRPVRQLEPSVLATLRLGLTQLLLLDGVAEHAAVDDPSGSSSATRRGPPGSSMR